MNDKIKYVADLITYQEAAELFETENDLLNALKMGRVLALGRIQHYVDLPDMVSSLMHKD